MIRNEEVTFANNDVIIYKQNYTGKERLWQLLGNSDYMYLSMFTVGD